ncbi:secretoglobin family 3A member 1 [Hyaena hyaena]|uniref:secretoglobin family 3A member 1 n=1 Tax=Hyaena hyaena TaxID=95912 RepID=UPI0019240BD1|nr:secretoglobin family 3A member 1 [Hyaena hyaena]
MKLTAAFLVLCVALLSHPAATFFVDTVAKPVASALTNLKPAVEAGAEALAGAGDLVETAAMAGAGPIGNPLLQGFSPLKFILNILGVPVKHLMEGSRKYAAELSPEAVGAMKSLLGALTYLG